MANRRGRRGGPLHAVATWVRRIRRVIMIGSAVASAYAWWRSRSPGSPPGRGGGGGGRPAPIGSGPRPSLQRAPAEPDSPTPEPTPAVVGAWIDPVDGGCPPSHPIKASGTSRVFHVPGGRSYARTSPARCYADADAAVADGYRQAKA